MSLGTFTEILLRFPVTPPYLFPPTNRKWQWVATEIVQIAVHHVECCQLLQIFSSQ
jgi:hypothetical protein